MPSEEEIREQYREQIGFDVSPGRNETDHTSDGLAYDPDQHVDDGHHHPAEFDLLDIPRQSTPARTWLFRGIIVTAYVCFLASIAVGTIPMLTVSIVALFAALMLFLLGLTKPIEGPDDTEP